MNFFKKAEKVTQYFDNAIKSSKTDEWIWVEGYKGTDSNMCCKDFQYELNRQFDIEGTVAECKNGFHFCRWLGDVFDYRSIGNNNRFFKVKGLVRQSDLDAYRIHYIPYNKLVAKSIIFMSELCCEDILAADRESNGKLLCGNDVPDKYKAMALNIGVEKAVEQYQIDTLIADGYSISFANYIIQENEFEVAHAVGSQPDLSMDMKVLYIFTH